MDFEKLNIFDLDKDFLLVTNADKEDVQEAIRIVKEVSNNSFIHPSDIEVMLSNMGFEVDLRLLFECEKIEL